MTLAVTWLVPPRAGAFSVGLSGIAPEKTLTVTSDGASAVRVYVSGGSVIVDKQEFSDPAETATRGDGCTGQPWDPYTVCGPLVDVGKVVFEGGQGDDWFALFNNEGSLSAELDASGGGGADRLLNGSALGSLDGGPGADRLEGRGGDDELLGGPGDDELIGGPGSDLLDGGAGADNIVGDAIESIHTPPGPDDWDVVDYGSRTSPVTVTLRHSNPPDYGTAPGGEVGEGDRLRDIEGVLGGSGDDTLTGDQTDNTLDGGSGDDMLEGGGGDDTLDGGLGADELSGGSGSDAFDGGPDGDSLDTFDGIADGPIACGDGADLLFADNGLDLGEMTGCEVVAPEFLSPARVSGTALEGSPLTYVPMVVSGTASTLSFEWHRCDNGGCTAIAGARGDTYVPTAADVGRRLILVVTASNAAGIDESVAEAPGTVAPRTPAAVPTVPPIVPPPASATLLPTRVATLVGGRRSRTVDAGRASCPPGATPCSVRFVVTWTRGSRRVRAAHGILTISGGRSARLRFTLNRKATAHLRRRGRLRLRLVLTANRPPAAPARATAAVTVRIKRRA